MSLARTRWIVLACLLLCCGISVLWGSFLQRNSPHGMGDFKAVYYAARCLVQHRDPYKVGEPLRVYLAEGGGRVGPSDSLQEVLSLHIYPPTTFMITAPFAMLPWVPAQILWMVITIGSLLAASFLLWRIGANYDPVISGGLIGFLNGLLVTRFGVARFSH